MTMQMTTTAANGNCCAHKRCDETQPCTAQGFERPHFFAGQLLTEDDLESLSAYVVGKNRLHNRYLWGDGVACGLRVKAHPCGGGRVIVEPGYALDCCGNDLVLACAEELDINAMARQLRIATRGGYDCGDPCANGDAQSGAHGKLPGKATGADAAAADAGTERYGLYLRYSETQTAPVSPYQVDEPCTGSRCEWTRVQEGVRFELRCYSEPAAENTLCTQLTNCLDDVYALERDLTQAVELQQMVAQLQQLSAPAEPAEAAPVFGLENVVQLKEKSSVLEKFLARLDDGSAPESLDSVEVTNAVRAAADVGAMITRYRLLDAAGQADIVSKDEKAGDAAGTERLPEALKRAVAAVKKLKLVDQPMIEMHVKDPLERANVKAALRIAQVLGAELKPLDEAQARKSETLQLLNNTFITPETYQVVSERFLALKNTLVEKLSVQGDAVHRATLASVRASQLPAWESDQPVTQKQMVVAINAGKRMVGGYRKLLQECLCEALMPACADCEDPAVLLACIEVRDCEIIEICNMVRKFVLTPPNLRHWLPPLGRLGQALTRACCPDSDCQPEPEPSTLWFDEPQADYVVSEKVGFGGMASWLRPAGMLSFLLGDCLDTRKATGDVADQRVGHIVALFKQVSGGEAPAVASGLLQGVKHAPAGAAQAVAPARQPAAAVSAAEVTRLMQSPQASAALDALLAEKVKRLDADLQKRLSGEVLEKALDGSDALKGLASSIRSLQAKNRELEKQLKRLQGG